MISFFSTIVVCFCLGSLFSRNLAVPSVNYPSLIGVHMVQVRQWVPRAPFSMSKMCAMDRRGGAGDVGAWTARPGNMNSGVHHVDMNTRAPRADISARHRRLAISPRCIPSIPTLLP